MLVPNDQAFDKWEADNAGLAADGNYTKALMEYHFLQESLATGDFAENSFFPHSLLSDRRYANVTGGQVVELTARDGMPAAVSGVQAVCHITSGDILYEGGLVQIMDSVLTIPAVFSVTFSTLKLTNLLALLNKGGFVDPNLPSFKLINSAPDLSIFAPNEPKYGASYTGFEGLAQEEIRRILNYSTVATSPVLYSSEFKNNTKRRNLANLDLLFTNANSKTYVDQAELKFSNFLIANGVLQLTDSILNPNTTLIGPVISPATPAATSSGGLSGAAAAGIGIAAGAVILGLLIGGALWTRQRKRRGLPLCGGGSRKQGRPRYRPGQQRLDEQDTPGIPRPVPRTIGGGAGSDTYSRAPTYNSNMELNPHINHQNSFYDPRSTVLSDAPPPHYGTHELDNKTFPSPPGTADNNSNNGGRRHHRWQRSRGNVSVVEIYNSDGTVTTTRSGRNSRLDEPLPPKPMTPQEIDGTERTRIEVHITGEQPRHLGFQARY